jgi:calmodulin
LADARITLSDPQFRRFITLIDSNGDGWVDFAEFQSVFTGAMDGSPIARRAGKLSAAQLEERAQTKRVMDQIRDKVAAKSAHLQKARARHSCSCGASADPRAQVFRMFDEDHDGTVSRDELRRGLAVIGLPLSDPDLARLMGVVDKNGDGVVNYEEFAHAFKGDLCVPVRLLARLGLTARTEWRRHRTRWRGWRRWKPITRHVAIGLLFCRERGGLTSECSARPT